MFNQFKVDTKHRDFLRFLWWDGGDYDARPTEYRICVHLFGAVSSPGCANVGLKQAATVKRNLEQMQQTLCEATSMSTTGSSLFLVLMKQLT